MAPARRWNLADFALVLDAPDSPTADLAARLPRRRPAEIDDLRAAVHAQHVAQRLTVPLRTEFTEPMSRYLSRRRGTLTCAVCGVGF
jgi:hypothetical protein